MSFATDQFNEPAVDALTARERELIALLVDGVVSNRALAERMVVSEHTVHYHISNIMLKLATIAPRSSPTRLGVTTHGVREGGEVSDLRQGSVDDEREPATSGIWTKLR